MAGVVFGQFASYFEAEEGDVEAGESLFEDPRAWAQDLFDSVQEDVGEALGSAGGFLGEAGTALGARLPAWAPSKSEVRSSAAATVEASRRFRGFVLIVLFSVLCFALAMFVGLPAVVVRPQKFAVSFTLGSLSFMGSFAVLRGWRAHVRTLTRRDRLPFSAAYVATMVATLYASVVARSFFLTLASTAAQFTTLLYYLGSYVPGGARGVRLGLAALQRMLTHVLRPLCCHAAKCCFNFFPS